MSADDHLSQPQFFHGTNARLSPGDHITPGYRKSQYDVLDEATHVFTTTSQGKAGSYANWARSLAGMGEIPGPQERHVYEVEHTGPYESVPSPMNPATIYQRSKHPARVVREVPYVD